MLSAAWRSRWWIWVLPLVFVLANATVLVFHPGRTGAGFSLMQEDLEQEGGVLRRLQEKRDSLESVLAVASSNQGGVQELYEQRFSSQSERLTALLGEVKGLAVRAGFAVPRMNYPEQTIDEFGLVRKGIDFQVEGSYAQFRNFLNLIELSDYFLILERVALRGSDGPNLSVNLNLSTLFVDDPGRPSPPAGGSP